ncbi:16S rRNA (guanine(966)-N(2))-methyltransferase RsmD [Sporolactobacillus sp. THM7-7]|nr:16S rRNA (guanine(966)-N(2))-methyltransferase RsmD [Sporolactobacillus sp. THM7-7]
MLPSAIIHLFNEFYTSSGDEFCARQKKAKGGKVVRVIAGENKGRILKPVAGRMTRPTTDKVKETIFNMIGPFFDGGVVLDLYGGSGALGIEALSRGADRAVFVEKAPAACRVIRENVGNCRYDERAEIYKYDARRALERFSDEGRTFDYVFLDPPYASRRLTDDLGTLLNKHLLAGGATVVCEHEDAFQLPDTFPGTLVRQKYKTYQGKTAVSIYTFKKDN